MENKKSSEGSGPEAAFRRGKRRKKLLEVETGLMYRQKLAMGL